jgi:hypothetical protein
MHVSVPSSCPGIDVRRTASLPLAYARASTSFELDWNKQDVDGQVKPGQDETGMVSVHGTHQGPLAFRTF